MNTLEELKSLVGFGPHDEAWLHAFAPLATPHLPALADHFYARILAHPSPEGQATSRAIAKITDIDLAIMTGTYVQRREENQVRTLQDILVSHLPVTVLLLDDDGVVTTPSPPCDRTAY